MNGTGNKSKRGDPDNWVFWAGAAAFQAEATSFFVQRQKIMAPLFALGVKQKTTGIEKPKKFKEKVLDGNGK